MEVAYQDLEEGPRVVHVAHPSKAGNQLLDRLVAGLKAEAAPGREGGLKQGGGTVLSDGWNDVNSAHLINLLLTTRNGTYFDGTIELGSEGHEDAEAVAKILIA